MLNQTQPNPSCKKLKFYNPTQPNHGWTQPTSNSAIDMGRKAGCCCAPFGGTGSPTNTMCMPGTMFASVPSDISWPIQPFGHRTHGPRIGGCVPFGGAVYPSNVAWADSSLHTKWHSNPSNRLATIYQRYRQDMQDRQTDRQQRSGGIGRTVLQTVRPKTEGLLNVMYASILYFWQRCML